MSSDSWLDEPPGDDGPGGGFADPGAAFDGSTGRSPDWLVWVGGASVLAGAALLLVDRLPASIAGYLLASVVAFCLVALFRRSSQQRLFLAGIVTPRSTKTIAVIVLVAGFAVSVAQAWQIARHFS